MHGAMTKRALADFGTEDEGGAPRSMFFDAPPKTREYVFRKYHEELVAILSVAKKRAKEAELILAGRSTTSSSEGNAAETPPCQVCCQHVYLPVYPAGPRDNGEFESRCEKCGLPQYR